MIKLKVYVPQDGPYGLVPEEGGAPVEEETCYLKSEVDRVIAEKDAKIKKLEKCKQWMKDHFHCKNSLSVYYTCRDAIDDLNEAISKARERRTAPSETLVNFSKILTGEKND